MLVLHFTFVCLFSFGFLFIAIRCLVWHLLFVSYFPFSLYTLHCLGSEMPLASLAVLVLITHSPINVWSACNHPEACVCYLHSLQVGDHSVWSLPGVPGPHSLPGAVEPLCGPSPHRDPNPMGEGMTTGFLGLIRFQIHIGILPLW